MVITKSISRFARNTVDTLTYIRQLKERNIAVYFEKENINTLDAKGEILLTIMASLAQQESQSLSENVRLGLQYRYQKGKVMVVTSRFLGYDMDKEGKLIVNPEQAKVVKRIYREFLEGKSYYEIGKGLMEDGIPTGAGNLKWQASTLKKILTNEKYIGDALLQKTVTTDFLKKKRVPNKGILPQYYIEDNHEAIIPRELFTLVREEMVRRASIKDLNGRTRVYSSKYALSHLVFCGECGDVFRRTQWTLNGQFVPVWRCAKRMKQGKNICASGTLYEEELKELIVKAFNQVIEDQEVIIPELIQAVDRALLESNDPQIREIESQIDLLQQELIYRTQEKLDAADVTDAINKLRVEKEKLLVEDAERVARKKRVEEIERFLREHSVAGVTSFDDGLVRRMVKRIVVKEGCVEILFKAGLKTSVATGPDPE